MNKARHAQVPLPLGRGTNVPTRGFINGGVSLFACTSRFLRAMWDREYRLRLLLPERPALTQEDIRQGRCIAGNSVWGPGEPMPRWEVRIPVVRTESEEWLAGTRGNDRAQVRLEVINTEFFPSERDELIHWMDDGQPMDPDHPLTPILQGDMEEWFIAAIRSMNVGPDVEAALNRVPLPSHVADNLRDNLMGYRTR